MSVPTVIGYDSQHNPIYRFDAIPNTTNLTPHYNPSDYAERNDNGDMALAINRAISGAASAGYGIVDLDGFYPTKSTIVLSGDNVILRASGLGTVIQPQAGFTGDVIATPIPSVEGASGYIRQYCGIERLHIDCSKMSGTFTQGTGNAIHFYGTRYCWVKECRITSMPNLAISLDGDNTSPGQNFGYNNLIWRNIFDLGSGGIYCNASEANDIVQNQFKQANANMASAQPYWSDANPAPSTTGRHLTATTGYQYVAGNVFGNSGSYTSEAILITNAGSCRVIGNRFDQVHAQAIHNWSGGHVIEGNTFSNCGSTVANTPTVDLGAGGSLVVGNKWDSSNSNNYCVKEEGTYAPGSIIEGNQMLAGTAGYLSLNASTVSRASGNVGYNPVGLLASQPAVPASGTAITNNHGVDCVVYINGGTVTNVLINGSATGLTTSPITVRVPSGQTVAIDYSAAPTWTWFGE